MEFTSTSRLLADPVEGCEECDNDEAVGSCEDATIKLLQVPAIHVGSIALAFLALAFKASDAILAYTWRLNLSCAIVFVLAHAGAGPLVGLRTGLLLVVVSQTYALFKDATLPATDVLARFEKSDPALAIRGTIAFVYCCIGAFVGSQVAASRLNPPAFRLHVRRAAAPDIQCARTPPRPIWCQKDLVSDGWAFFLATATL
jgi:hypothetical protein